MLAARGVPLAGCCPRDPSNLRASSRSACCGPRIAPPTTGKRRVVLCASAQDAHTQQAVIGVSPNAPATTSNTAGGPPFHVLALGAAGVAAVALAAFKRLRARAGYGSDPFEREVLRNVNMVPVEELSEEAIAMARARRSRESAFLKMDLEEVELPENHPWAVKKPMSQEQEAEIQARLQVRRGVGRRQSDSRDPEQAGTIRIRRTD